MALSIIAIGAQVVVAINRRLLHRPLVSGSDDPNEPLRFRPPEQAMISVAFAVAGTASLVGILDASKLAGSLAAGAAVLGVINIGDTQRAERDRLRHLTQVESRSKK